MAVEISYVLNVFLAIIIPALLIERKLKSYVHFGEGIIRKKPLKLTCNYRVPLICFARLYLRHDHFNGTFNGREHIISKDIMFPNF